MESEESICHSMRYNHPPDSDRRRLSLENLPGLYTMSFTQLLAQIHAIGTNSSVGAASIPSYAADSQISNDSWGNSWKIEPNPWILTPGSFHGTKTCIVGEGPMEKPQYEEPHDPIVKPFHEARSAAGEKEIKRGRAESDDDIAPLETPQPRQKRKKIRGKVAGDVVTRKSTSKSAVKKASATAPCANTSEVNTYVRCPKRSCRRSLIFNNDAEEEDGYGGLTFTSEYRIGTSSGWKIEQDATMRIFGNIPRGIRNTRTRSKRQTLKTDPKGSLRLPQNLETTLILHQKAYQQQKAAVQYKSDGSIIPYRNEKNYQTKVALDGETLRVWKLLMLSNESEGIDGLEEDKQKWWEEERNLFRDRANLFIARMSLVQGDRSFSPWKGSVVDSVVGVFLTQNVADHSSSSAFMDIAAEFPVISISNKELYHEGWESSVTDETVMNLDPGSAAPTPRISNPTIIFVDEIDDDEDVCSQKSSTSSDKSINSTNHSKTVLLDLLTNSSEANFDEGTRVAHTGDGRQQKPKTKTYQHDMKKKKNRKKPKESFDWDSLRREAESGGQKRQRTERTADTVDWDALRCTNVNEIADIIRSRGMNNMLSHRIKAFLNRLVQDHEKIDLEWLRDVPPDKAKEYLMSIDGIGLKSAECVRLLSLHQIAFPVDTNVGRIAVRLGWVPLQPLPDELQMHLLELYPVLTSVQKYLWPRLCKFDQKTLYELHYHMITFGKVFCTKVKPNCKACPMKAECRHYASASARASALRALPEAEEKGCVTIHQRRSNPNPVMVNQSLFLTQDKEHEESKRLHRCEPIIEEPSSPEIVCPDIEDFPDPWENMDSIPTIILNDGATISKDLVVISSQAASITRPKLKLIEKLRTEHYVYELPDNHHILEGFEKRELEDRVPYLLAIWTSGETASSIQPPEQKCVSQESNILCHEKTCFSCNNRREENAQVVRGTVLIPCRTAMRGGFPLNGTYFQTNEVFADHGSSINPIDVPRDSIGGLRRRIVYFGSSVSACFGGLSLDAIQNGFWTGYVCVRGFDRRSRKPKALVERLHCPPSKRKKDDY
ncbi:hypothetical protein EUTSA_v10019961mg [Eutrema salsugineum]|uniref:HhH-GPD domain-containing protein n=1 Tax=Eutrema salsugineum TaxID=72664 RepID=V4LYZ6_EUTSA|nr:DEMETER-like protein 2 [Eutrema salsugineum]XP_024015323.1 DEMETER-like protein 2 [Eutrema salsugineum]ESQ49069.1 hypothetical protein EUTSA_v10019961mg [Eutrema salsugineum]